MLTNLSTPSPPVAPRMLLWYLYIREKTELRCLMTIYPNRLLSRVIRFAYLPYRRKIQSASRCYHGFHQELFRPGWRLRPCARSCGGCGIIVITLQWTTEGPYGGRRAHIVLCYSCWYINPAGRTFSCHAMLRCLEVIWVVIEHWPDWPIASIGQGCLMM